jgi:hypothetical protein
LARSSASAGRLTRNHAGVSGTRKNTSGMNTSVAMAPNSNTTRQSPLLSSSAAIVPPTVAPMG